MVEYQGGLLACERPHRLEVQVGNDAVPLHAALRLHPDGDGTRLERVSAVVPHRWPAHLLLGLGRLMLRAIVRTQRAALKPLAEAAA